MPTSRWVTSAPTCSASREPTEEPSGATTPGMPACPTSSTGFSPLGNNDNWAPVFRDEKTYALAANLTKLHGSHQFRFGFSVNRLRLEHWQPELGAGPRGRFDFNGNVTNLRGGTQAANLYNQYAAMLLGLPNQVQQAIQYELMTTREWQHGDLRAGPLATQQQD